MDCSRQRLQTALVPLFQAPIGPLWRCAIDEVGGLGKAADRSDLTGFQTLRRVTPPTLTASGPICASCCRRPAKYGRPQAARVDTFSPCVLKIALLERKGAAISRLLRAAGLRHKDPDQERRTREPSKPWLPPPWVGVSLRRLHSLTSDPAPASRWARRGAWRQRSLNRACRGRRRSVREHLRGPTAPVLPGAGSLRGPAGDRGRSQSRDRRGGVGCQPRRRRGLRGPES